MKMCPVRSITGVFKLLVEEPLQQATLHRWRNMASDLEALLLILLILPFSSWLKVLVNRTTPRATSRDELFWLPTWSPAGSCLNLKILSTDIMNRTSNRGQHCPPSCPTHQGPRTPFLWSTNGIPRGTWSNATFSLIGSTPMNPQAPCGSGRAVPAFP